MRLSPSTKKWLPWTLLALAVVATTAVYWPGLAGGWVFDDYPNIVDNAAIHITPGHSSFSAWVAAALSSPASFLHRPLASITFALNWYFGGGNPWSFKVTNVIIHLVNGVLLFCMLRALLRLVGLPKAASPRRSAAPPFTSEGGKHDSNASSSLVSGQSSPSPLPPSAGRGTEGDGFPLIDDTAATRLALIVSAAWMLLPINLMAVLYVVQRMESLCQVFVLAGLWAYLHGRWMMLTADKVSRERRGLALAAAGIVFGTLLGLTSKETAVLLPVFAFLAEAVLLRFRRRRMVAPRLEAASPRAARDPLPAEGGDYQPSSVPTTTDFPPPSEQNSTASLPPSTGRGTEGDGFSRTDKRLWAFFTVTLFIPAVLGFAWLLRGVLTPGTLAGRDFTLVQRLMTEPRVLVDYLHWTLFPNPQVLSLYHDEIVISTGLLSPWTTLGAMLLLAALIVIAVLLRNRRPLVALGIGWFFAAQLLTATIIPLELVYEQRMYFGSIGVLLAAGALLLGLRWRIPWSLPRGFIVVAALLWFGTATYLRAQEWSDPLGLAVAEADRHPESARATYEAGRQLLIASNYREGPLLAESWKYLNQASAIPGSSALADQALIMIADHQRHDPEDQVFWDSMTRKLRDQPTRQEDISALISLTNCYGSGICVFDVDDLQRAYLAALSRPHPIARLYGAYAIFQRDIKHDDTQALKYLALAVEHAPTTPAYRIELARQDLRQGKPDKAQQQIEALRQLNYGGRLDKQIAALERLTGQSRVPLSSR